MALAAPVTVGKFEWLSRQLIVIRNEWLLQQRTFFLPQAYHVSDSKNVHLDLSLWPRIGMVTDEDSCVTKNGTHPTHPRREATRGQLHQGEEKIVELIRVSSLLGSRVWRLQLGQSRLYESKKGGEGVASCGGWRTVEEKKNRKGCRGLRMYLLLTSADGLLFFTRGCPAASLPSPSLPSPSLIFTLILSSALHQRRCLRFQDIPTKQIFFPFPIIASPLPAPAAPAGRKVVRGDEMEKHTPYPLQYSWAAARFGNFYIRQRKLIYLQSLAFPKHAPTQKEYTSERHFCLLRASEKCVRATQHDCMRWALKKVGSEEMHAYCVMSKRKSVGRGQMNE
ncbi:hypothetical protein ACLOJK_012657 [Asimina triloba]